MKSFLLRSSKTSESFQRYVFHLQATCYHKYENFTRCSRASRSRLASSTSRTCVARIVSARAVSCETEISSASILEEHYKRELRDTPVATGVVGCRKTRRVTLQHKSLFLRHQLNLSTVTSRPLIIVCDSRTREAAARSRSSAAASRVMVKAMVAPVTTGMQQHEHSKTPRAPKVG